MALALPVALGHARTFLIDDEALVERGIGERDLQRQGFGLLHFELHGCVINLSAIAEGVLLDVGKRTVDGFTQGVIGVDEGCVLEGLQYIAVFSGKITVSLHHAQHAQGRRGIAVGVVSATGGDVHRAEHIAFAIQQTDDDVGSILLGIDVVVYSGTADVGIFPFVLQLVPCLLPVCGIFLVELQHILQYLIIVGPRGERARCLAGFPELCHAAGLACPGVATNKPFRRVTA